MDAVVYYRVIDPVKAIINVQNYAYAVSQVAQTSLRSVIGQSDMDQLLSERDKINARLKDVIDEPTEEPWGIRVERVEVKDVSLPESMKRSMSRQAEAERERRARIISADGEYQASKKLAQAAAVMAADPAALQLRLLQTVVEVAAEKNSTLVMPVPVELLRFFDRAAPAAAPTAAQPAGATPPAPPPRRQRPAYPRSRCQRACQPVPLGPPPSTPPPKHPPPSDQRYRAGPCNGRGTRGGDLPRPVAAIAGRLGSAPLLDADQVARGIAEGAVANAVRLVGRLLDDLGVAALQPARRCRRGPWWPGGSSRRCPWPSFR